LYEHEDIWRVSTTSAIYHSNASSDSGLRLVSLSDRELSRFIASGRLSAKIDKVAATFSSFVTLFIRAADRSKSVILLVAKLVD
jgi:hypothetical protein